MSAAETGGTARTGAKAPAERRYGGLTAQERRADRRRRLLDTALELFGTDGYPYTGIERICSHASVTARHFYEEFGSREGLLVALYDEIVDDIMQGVTDAVAAAPQDAVELTRAGLSAFVHGMVDDPRRARVTTLEVVGVSPALEGHRRTVLRLYAALVAEQSRVFGLDVELPERRLMAGAIALVGGTNELMTEWLTDTSAYRASVDELIDDLLALYVGVGRGGGVIAPDGATVAPAVPEPADAAAVVAATARRGGVSTPRITARTPAPKVSATRSPPAQRRRPG